MKGKKIVAIALLGVCLFAGAACRSGEPSSGGDKKTELLHGFNSVKELLTTYRVNVDNTQLCEDTAYVKEGNASMKISQTKAVAEGEFAPNMVIAMTPKNKYFNKETYSDSGYFSIDIYNGNDTVYELSIDVGNLTTDFYTLEKGWNTVTTNNLAAGKTLSHYELTFRSQAGKNAQFYLDNFTYHTTGKGYDEYKFDNTATEWFDFSHELQKTYFELGALVKPQSIFSAPHFSVTTDKKYNKTGAGALKVDFSLTNSGQLDVTAFQTREGMVLADFSKYLSEGGYGFFFDTYNGYEMDAYMEVQLVSTEGKTCSKRIKIPAQSWSDSAQSKIPLGEIMAAFGGKEINLKYVSYSFSGIQGAGSVYIDGVGIRK